MGEYAQFTYDLNHGMLVNDAAYYCNSGFTLYCVPTIERSSVDFILDSFENKSTSSHLSNWYQLLDNYAIYTYVMIPTQ
ncbi:hypothetical protein INT44_002207 [Umbelopsis vinacea]|uniref:Uncharacterized protein n=1 Tax=Umbelopsis vinacea TaxID=44442 RepID=A0A8H7Q650_9FUNG|nr:hypothetical protein INT44_002207 [Umbelopsis vinacea]